MSYSSYQAMHRPSMPSYPMEDEEIRQMQMPMRPMHRPKKPQVDVKPVRPVQMTKMLQDSSGKPSNPWGQGNTCLGLKILCAGLGALVVILVVILIIKMVHSGKQHAQTSRMSSGDSQLPMSLVGGFMDDSLLSTASN